MRQFVRQAADGRVSIIRASAPPPAAPGDVLGEITAAPIPRGQSARIEDGADIPVRQIPPGR